jgi:hypothetical protein
MSNWWAFPRLGTRNPRHVYAFIDSIKLSVILSPLGEESRLQLDKDVVENQSDEARYQTTREGFEYELITF